MSVSRPLWIGRRASFAVALGVVAGCDVGVGLDLFGPSETRPITIEIRGTVTAAADGRPLAGATVEDMLSVPPGVDKEDRATTDSLGRYSLSIRDRCPVSRVLGCRTPWLRLVAHLDGFDGEFEPRIEEREPRTVGDGVDVVDITVDFALRPTRPITLTVGGRLTTASSGEPVEAATVTVDWDLWHLPFDVPRDSARTDTDGRYLVTSHHFCAISGSSCFVSFRIDAEKDEHWSGRLFEDLNVVGDSISLTVGFDDF